MVSERAESQPSSHGYDTLRMTPQAAGTQALRQETEQARAQRASGTETSSGNGGTQQRSGQQTFAGDGQARNADSESYRQQSGFSADSNTYHRAADPAAGFYHPFAQNYSYPFGPSPFGYPSGMAPFWPFPSPPFFGFPPFGAAPPSPFYPGMMPFGFQPFPDQAAQSADPMRTAYPYASDSGWWHMLRWLWSHITSWWMWIFSGIPRGVPMPQNGNPSFDAILRMATAQADLMHQILLKAAEVADHTRKACQAFAEQGGAAYAPFGPTGPFATPGSPGTARPGAPVDMERLRQLLQAMDAVQAAQVMHAVQVVQAMDSAHRRQQAPSPPGW